MKDATFTGQSPRTEKEVEREIDRLLSEIGQMMRNTERHQDSTTRKQAATWESIRWLEEKLHVGKAA